MASETNAAQTTAASQPAAETKTTVACPKCNCTTSRPVGQSFGKDSTAHRYMKCTKCNQVWPVRNAAGK